MANTTNFNWETPDDTDLVKDGAAAIRTLGSAIDTSLVDLKGGTTGQVLSKTSNTDMDFTWVAQDDSNAIQNAIVDAKGDLISATAADTPARLAVGTDNQRLVAASGEATGLKYVSDTQNTVIDAAGDLVYGTAADTLGRLAIGTAGQVLTVNSGATAPEWKTPAAGSFVGVRANNNSVAQTISNATTTVLNFAAENYDTDGFHSTSTNTGRLTVPTGKAGYYRIYFSIQWNNNGTGRRSIGLYLNGTTPPPLVSAEVAVSSTAYPSCNGSTTYYLNDGDYVQLTAYQESGGNLNTDGGTNNHFGMEKIG